MKELHIVLEETNAPGGHVAEFIETEDEEGRGVGNFTLSDYFDAETGYRHVVVTAEDFG